MHIYLHLHRMHFQAMENVYIWRQNLQIWWSKIISCSKIKTCIMFMYNKIGGCDSLKKSTYCTLMFSSSVLVCENVDNCGYSLIGCWCADVTHFCLSMECYLYIVIYWLQVADNYIKNINYTPKRRGVWRKSTSINWLSIIGML